MRAVFIEANTTGSGREFACAAREAGLRPVVFCRRLNRYAPGYLDDVAEIVNVNTSSATAIMEAITNLDDEPRSVWSSSDYFVGIAATVARELGLPGPSPQAIADCNDKVQQIALLARSGLEVPRSVTVRTGDVDEEQLRELRPPLVVKPARGSGSSGVRVLGTFLAALDYALGLLEEPPDARMASPTAAALVQEFIEGPEFSVELFDGHAIAVLRKHLSDPPALVEIGHDLVRDTSGPEHARLHRSAERSVAALGLTWGPIHAEVRLQQGSRPVVIEVNPRLAGGGIPSLLRTASGLRLVEATLARAADIAPPVCGNATHHGSIRFCLAPTSGTLREVKGLEDARNKPAVAEVWSAQNGAQVSVGDFRQRVAYVIAVASTAGAAARHAEAAVEALVPIVDADEVDAHVD